MINKIFKTINNKFYKIFKFIFFIRYIFAIFFVAIVLFFTIPNFFDYSKKEQIIKNSLFKNYGIEIKEYKSITFSSFPTPNLKINDLKVNFNSNTENIKIQELTIYPEILNIYNYKKFLITKIKFNNSDVEIELKNFKAFCKNILKFEKKLSFKNLNLKIDDNGKNSVNLKNINFSNYGYKKNIIEGEIFKRKFEINSKDKFKDIKFKLLETGIYASLSLSEYMNDQKFNGRLKGKILNSNFKLDFVLEKNIIKLKELLFRNKKLSFNSNGKIKLRPFFLMDLNSEVKKIDPDFFNNLNIFNLIEEKNLIKRLNVKNNLYIMPKKFGKSLIENLNLETNLVYGRLNIIKKFSISNSNFICNNNINLLKDFPIAYFNCNMNSPDLKKMLKKIGIRSNLKNKEISIKITGNLNLLNQKINFDSIIMNKKSKLNEEDLKYYKTTFENILFNENFFKIFDLKKVSKFILEIS